MKVRIVGDRVLVRVQEGLKSSLIIIPDSVKGKPQEGVVVQVGDGFDFATKIRNISYIKEGDEILFGKNAVRELNLGGEKLLLMGSENVMGVIS